MQYQVEDISNVKRKINVQVPAEEVNAALNTAIALFNKDLKMPGFRKGKVPASIVEQRFKKDIYEQAYKDLLNVHFNQILGELELQPVSELSLDVPEFVKDQDFNYSFSFEVSPAIDLPEYHGLQGTQKKVEVTESMVDKMVERIRQEKAELKLVKEDRYPQDGDVVVIDFAAYKNGELLQDYQAKGFELTIGEGQALQDFIAIIKGLKPGQQGQGEVTFPSDFINEDLAGDTVIMQVTLNVIKERVLPEVDDDLAEKAGGYSSVEQMRQTLAQNLESFLQGMEKSMTQKKLLDQLVAQVQFDLPESMIEAQVNRMLQEKRDKMERQGKRLEYQGSEEEMKQEHRPEAEELIKGHLVLLEVAKKEDLQVAEQEVEQQIYRQAINSGQDPKALRDYYEKNNMMFSLRDSLLADKAMEVIYNYAQIEEIEPGTEGEVSGETGEEASQADAAEDEHEQENQKEQE